MAKGRGFGGKGMAGGMGAGGGMMSQIKKLQEQMEATQAALADETVTATVGGGAIKVTMTGDQVCKAIVIDPELLKDADAEMLQDMILSGVNMALDQSRKLADDRMGPLAGGLSGLGLVNGSYDACSAGTNPKFDTGARAPARHWTEDRFTADVFPAARAGGSLSGTGGCPDGFEIRHRPLPELFQHHPGRAGNVRDLHQRQTR